MSTFRHWFPTGLFALACLATGLSNARGETLHVVEKGQTIGWIARRYRVSIESVLDANNLRKWQQIHPGLPLVIPEGTGTRSAGAPGRRTKLEAKVGGYGARGDGRGKGNEASSAERGSRPLVANRFRRGYVHLIRGAERFEGQLLTRRGRVAPAALSAVTRVLRWSPTGASLPIDSRLAALIGAVSDHFAGRSIHVVSGYRPYSPAQYTAHSNHNVGRAMDFFVDGVPNATVRDYCRTLRDAGVGYYPNSTFVHLDARTGKAYWVDHSGPGEAPRYESNQSEPDEAAHDVEPHAGSADGAPPSRGGVDGSAETP
jgi:uncharacterized protein YcbK (DUF882 family)